MYKIDNALAVANLSFPTQSLPGELIREIAKQHSLFIQPYETAQPEIIVGQDNWRLLASSETRILVGTDVAITATPLGWVAHGVTSTKRQHGVFMMRKNSEVLQDESCTECCAMTATLDLLIREFFKVESLGVKELTRPNPAHERALKILMETSRSLGKVWETGLLWNSVAPPRVDSRAMAANRLCSLERKLDKNPRFAALYYKEMDRLIKNGYAIQVDDNRPRSRVWYLPHFGVTNDSKPDRVRLVFDAAAKASGISLSDQLDAGPDLLQALPGVLSRFRLHAVACKADIRDMYLRVRVVDNDQGALRFLWRGADRKGYPETYEMTCLVFGAKSSPCSAHYVKDANAERFRTDKPAAAASIVKNSYVDDFLVSFNSATELQKLIRDVIDINSHANFEMHGWASNEAEAVAGLCEGAKESRRVENAKTFLFEAGDQHVLGLYWDTASDQLGFNVGLRRIPTELLNQSRKPTKREYLKTMMSVYDPLGLLAPFMLSSKLILQDVWRSGIGWDEQLRDEENDGWVAWLKCVRGLASLKIPRCLTPKGRRVTATSLHAFGDASLKAVAAGVYIRSELDDGTAHVALVMAKSRVVANADLSVSRLELQAALVASRLIANVADELKIEGDKWHLWSDSRTVLHWLVGEPRRRSIYVAHRLGEINELTGKAKWRWVPSGLNPVDCATRGVIEEGGESSMWFNGPAYLKLPETCWLVPPSITQAEKGKFDEEEARKEHRVLAMTATTRGLSLAVRVLGWKGLLITTRRVRKYFDRWAHRALVTSDCEERRWAEEYWYRVIQAESYPHELRALQMKSAGKKSSRLAKFTPLLDDTNVMRVVGRVTKVLDVGFVVNPIILDGNHPATWLLIVSYHRRFYHANHETVINELKQKYHVLGLRTALKSIISQCLVCKIRRAKPNIPLMAPLPDARLSYRQRPFSHCGIDYFGPLFVKVKRSREKRWGILCTCLTTRAVYLDVAHSLTTGSAIMALQRLAADRGTPAIVYSDNGTNFRGACAELREGVNKLSQEKLHAFALRNGMEWRFNPPDAPHMGGAWERLVRSVKIALEASLANEVVTDETLLTALKEIAHSVNSRPLTHVSVDPGDCEALTPNHFLIGSSSGEFKLGSYDKRQLCSRGQWRMAQALADAFWNRWLREYVPTLQARQKWHAQTESVKMNDVVLVVDMQAPRNSWRKGKIVKLYPGADGVVRAVMVRANEKEFVRPVYKIIKLMSTEEVQN